MEMNNCDLLWRDKPTESGWYWMRYSLSSKPAMIKKVDWFHPYFIINTSPLHDWNKWEFYGPLKEPPLIPQNL
jgi:hypothetical protein